jgi:hypothetical protein
MVCGSRVVRGILLAAVLSGCHSSSSGQKGDGGAAGTSGGGGAAGGAVGGDPSTPEGFCKAFYAIVFDSYVTCKGVALSEVQPLVDDTTVCQRLTASLAAHRSSFAPAKAQACLDELAAAFACNSSGLLIPDCVGTVLVPLVPIGGTCAANDTGFIPYECTGGGYCKQGPNQSCDGTCTLPAAVGQPCDLLNDVRCGANLTCDATSKTCVMQPLNGAVGATCDNISFFCARGLYCDKGADGGANGTCQSQKTSGPCTSDECAAPSQCAGPTGAKTCVAPKHPGDSCTPKQGECDLFGFCGADHKCSSTYAGVGQPCGPQPASDNVPCTLSEYCDAPSLQGGGTCRAKKQPGEACTGTVLFECDGNGGHCDSTTKKCVACPF